MKQIKCIKETDKVPKGWEYLTSWKFEEINDKNPELLKPFKCGWYILQNTNKKRAVCFCYYVSGFRIIGDYFFGNCDSGLSRGVLIIKKDGKEMLKEYMIWHEERRS